MGIARIEALVVVVLSFLPCDDNLHIIDKFMDIRTRTIANVEGLAYKAEMTPDL